MQRIGRSSSVLAVLSTALALHASPACRAGLVEWSSAGGGNGHFYEVVVVSTAISWTSARDAAVAAGGHLATITSAGENAFVSSLVTLSGQNAFLGGYQVDPGASANAGWAWVTGEEWGYTNWAGGEPNDQGSPNESFLEMWGGGVWNDVPEAGSGYSQFAYVVEFVPGPGGFAIVGAVGFAVGRRRDRGDRS